MKKEGREEKEGYRKIKENDEEPKRGNVTKKTRKNMREVG